MFPQRRRRVVFFLKLPLLVHTVYTSHLSKSTAWLKTLSRNVMTVLLNLAQSWMYYINATEVCAVLPATAPSRQSSLAPILQTLKPGTLAPCTDGSREPVWVGLNQPFIVIRFYYWMCVSRVHSVTLLSPKTCKIGCFTATQITHCMSSFYFCIPPGRLSVVLCSNVFVVLFQDLTALAKELRAVDDRPPHKVF